jgi:predicted Ser/Thr protein kinase
MPSAPAPTLDELRSRVRKVFRQGGGSRPEVSLVEYAGALAVLKDYTRSDPLFHRLIGPLSVRREARALRLLDGVAGVPRLLAVFDGNAVVLEYVAGPSARELGRGALTPAFFERLHRLVGAMHARGVAHCDLRSSGNILLGPDQTPFVVDFVANFRRGRWWNPLTRWMFTRLCEADRGAIARLKNTHAPELLTPEEHAALARDRKTPLERGARVIGRGVRDLSRWLLTRSK